MSNEYTPRSILILSSYTVFYIRTAFWMFFSSPSCVLHFPPITSPLICKALLKHKIYASLCKSPWPSLSYPYSLFSTIVINHYETMNETHTHIYTNTGSFIFPGRPLRISPTLCQCYDIRRVSVSFNSR